MRYFFSKSRNCGIPLYTRSTGKSTAPPRLTPAKPERVLYMAVLALITGLSTSAIALAMLALFRFITNLAFFGERSFDTLRPDKHDLGIWVIAIPVAGSLIVAVIDSVVKTGIPARANLLYQFRSIISIGTGAPLGPEGPAMDAGTVLGKWIGGLFNTSVSETAVLLVSGATAAIAFIFGAPMAAIVLAAELWLAEYSFVSGISVLLAALAGATFRQVFYSAAPFFVIPAIKEPQLPDLLLYTLVGIGIGIVAALMVRAAVLVRSLFVQLPLKPYWLPVIGAVFIGVIGFFEPATFGPGYHLAHTIMNGNITFHLVIVLIVFKFLSWLAAQATGTPGGAMAPMIVMGAALGVLLTALLQFVFREVQLNVYIAAVIGMAAMFAGASRAWVAAVILALECTKAPNALLPLALSCTAAYFSAYLFLKKDIIPTQTSTQ